MKESKRIAKDRLEMKLFPFANSLLKTKTPLIKSTEAA